MRVEDWNVSHRGGALHLIGWFRAPGGGVVRVSSGRLVGTRIGRLGREVQSRGGVGPVESCMVPGGIVRDGCGREYALGTPATAA
jgi:hypothetical protein